MDLLLEAMGHPERDFRVIHVAGTNGKGSVCAFLESIFRISGVKTGMFTSPHLVRINERYKVSGEDIRDDEFLDAFREVCTAVDKVIAAGGHQSTFFEYIFALGLCWFRRKRIDLLICETGLGGRLDATNSIQDVLAVVITSISFDHMAYLGDSIEKIAGEKAGIIRPDTPVVYCAKDPVSRRVIELKAGQLNAEQIPLTEDCVRVISRERMSSECVLTLPEQAVKKLPGRVSRELALVDAIRLHIPFMASYQTENAALAAVCAFRCGASLRAVQEGIARTFWPGRMEEIRRDVFLDGAHNIGAVCRLSEDIRRISRTRKISLLLAIVADKDHRAMVAELCRSAAFENVIATSAGGGRRIDAGILAEEFASEGQQNVTVVNDLDKAYSLALRKQGDSVLICAGSLYLVGGILEIENRRCGCTVLADDRKVSGD